ncbi:MAG: recombinase family protein [Pseudonocardiales bacterium]|nr:recombinase family protein [Pseudonocardiales bacterium]
MSLVLDIYARVSRLGDDRQRSTAGQVEDCRARIEERGAQVGEVHVDSGRSAWNPRVRRPDWERLMARLEAGATGGVIVFDMARFSRRPIEGERLILAAERGLVVLDSEGEYDLTTANGRKTFRDQLNAAAYESDRLSTRVKRGKRVKATRGEPNHSWRPFGFEHDGVTVRESEAVVLREMAARVLTGEKFDHVARDLNQRGVTTSTDGMWSRESVKQLLSRERNVGQVVHNGVVVGHLPGEPILDSETWERLTTLFASRRRGRPASEMYLCSGIVCCGKCGNRLTGRPKQPYSNGEIRREYFCHPRTVRGGCGGTAIGQRELDRHVGALVVRILSDPRHAEALEAAAKATEDKRRPVLAELSECEHLAEELSGRLGRREIPIQRYDVAIAPLDKRIAELRAELAELDSKAPAAVADPAIVSASREEWTARWNAATVAERRNLIRQALTNRKIVIAPFVPSSGRRKFDPQRIVIEEEHHAHSRLAGLPCDE